MTYYGNGSTPDKAQFVHYDLNNVTIKMIRNNPAPLLDAGWTNCKDENVQKWRAKSKCILIGCCKVETDFGQIQGFAAEYACKPKKYQSPSHSR